MVGRKERNERIIKVLPLPQTTKELKSIECNQIRSQQQQDYRIEKRVTTMQYKFHRRYNTFRIEVAYVFVHLGNKRTYVTIQVHTIISCLFDDRCYGSQYQGHSRNSK